ncbi:hypothetical protein GF406_16435 [candidate division KSB1 bacterium]|nr:hypothetical protein [candidate division KSB1 bacterium]
MSINETVLEMHYHSALLDVFRKTLGLGKGKFNFFKYSPQKECFVGFDQAYVQTDLSEHDLFQNLKSSAINNRYQLKNFFFGYFLQFKVVKKIHKRSRFTPKNINRNPHLRVSLDTTKNVNSGFSQHELLYNLNQNNGAFVYYACPMLFERTDLYNCNPDLDLLRLVVVTSCPSTYSDNEKHFIYFDNITSSPVWCSEPVEGKSISPKEFASNLVEILTTEEFYQNIVELFENLLKPIKSESEEEKSRILDHVSDQFFLIQFQAEEEA